MLLSIINFINIQFLYLNGTYDNFYFLVKYLILFDSRGKVVPKFGE